MGVESTIVAFDDGSDGGIGGERPVLLRPGGLPLEALEAATGGPIAIYQGGYV